MGTERAVPRTNTGGGTWKINEGWKVMKWRGHCHGMYASTWWGRSAAISAFPLHNIPQVLCMCVFVLLSFTCEFIGSLLLWYLSSLLFIVSHLLLFTTQHPQGSIKSNPIWYMALRSAEAASSCGAVLSELQRRPSSVTQLWLVWILGNKVILGPDYLFIFSQLLFSMHHLTDSEDDFKGITVTKTASSSAFICKNTEEPISTTLRTHCKFITGS